MLDYVKQSNNPWNVNSIFDFCYFCCPECDWKVTNTHTGKQEFVNHASIYHTSALVSLKQISDGSTEDIDFTKIQVEIVQLEVKNDHLENSEMLTNYLSNESKSILQGEGINCFDFESEKNNKHQDNANLSKEYDDKCDKELEEYERKFDDDSKVTENSELECEKIEEQAMFNSFDENFSKGEMTEALHKNYDISDYDDASSIQNYNIDHMKMEEESDFEDTPIDSNCIKGN